MAIGKFIDKDPKVGLQKNVILDCLNYFDPNFSNLNTEFLGFFYNTSENSKLTKLVKHKLDFVQNSKFYLMHHKRDSFRSQ